MRCRLSLVEAYSKVECNLCALLLDVGKETGLFIWEELVGKSGGRDNGGQVEDETQSCQLNCQHIAPQR